MLREVTADDLRRLRARAAASPRRRANLNLHPSPGDTVQRFFNSIEPGAYVRPHRHARERWEAFVLLAGAVGVLTFDDGGEVVQRIRLETPVRHAVEIAGGVWHTLVTLASGTLVFEVKPGPYDRSTDKEFAPWAPAESETTPAAALLAGWERSFALTAPRG